MTAVMTTTTMMGDDDDNDGGGSQRATEAKGMVWGRRQAAGGDKNGYKAEMGTMWV